MGKNYLNGLLESSYMMNTLAELLRTDDRSLENKYFDMGCEAFSKISEGFTTKQLVKVFSEYLDLGSKEYYSFNDCFEIIKENKINVIETDLPMNVHELLMPYASCLVVNSHPPGNMNPSLVFDSVTTILHERTVNYDTEAQLLTMKIVSNAFRIKGDLIRLYEPNPDLESEIITYYTRGLFVQDKSLSRTLKEDNSKELRAEAFHLTFNILKNGLSKDYELPFHEMMYIPIVLHKFDIFDYMDLEHLKECVETSELTILKNKY